MNKWGRRLIALVGPCALAYIVYSTDWKAVNIIIQNADLAYIVLALLTMLPTVLIRAERWRMLSINNSNTIADTSLLSSRNSLLIYSYGIFAGIATPGRLGEFIKVAHLKDMGFSIVTSVAITLVDRLFDVVALVIFGCIALARFTSILSFDFRNIILFVSISAVAGILALLLVHRYAKKIFDKISRSVSFFSIKTLAKGMILTIFAWILNYYAFYLANLGLHLGFSFIDILTLAAVSSLVSMIPISTMGVGTRDAVLIWLLNQQGIAKESALTLSFSFLLLGLTLGLICGLSALSPIARIARKKPSFPVPATRSLN